MFLERISSKKRRHPELVSGSLLISLDPKINPGLHYRMFLILRNNILLTKTRHENCKSRFRDVK